MTAVAPLLPGPLGRTGLRATRLALGDIAFRADGAPLRERLSPDDVERAFLEYGVNTFLVAPAMRSLCEGLRRLIRAGHRDKLTLVSATGLLPFAWSVRRSFEKTARVLGTDHLDVFLVGWVRRRFQIGQAWPVLTKLRERGRVRAVGFSSHDRSLALALARELHPDVMMLRYNAAHRGVEREVFEPLGEDRPAVISYTATRWGLLLQPLPEAGFHEPMRAPECYRFVLGHSSVDVALCAPGSLAELAEDVEGVRAGPLAPRRIEEVMRFGDAVHRAARGGARWMFRQG